MIALREISLFANDLSPHEILLLLSADDAGRIPFPEGSYREISVFMDALHGLEEKHHVQRRTLNGWRPYCLTKSGAAIRSRINGAGMKVKTGPSPGNNHS